MQQESYHRFKRFVVSSIAVVCVKVFLKLLLILFVWLGAATRELTHCRAGLRRRISFPTVALSGANRGFCGSCWLLTSRTWKSHLLVFFVELRTSWRV